MKGIIHIGVPELRTDLVAGRTALTCRVSTPKEERLLFMAVEPEYGPFLVTDRADCFVTALLTTAMTQSWDLQSQAPVTGRLLVQLRSFLIPLVSGKIPQFHPVDILAAPTQEPLISQRCVGLGWTGGVDSLYAYLSIKKSADYPKVTHLVHIGGGALEGGNDHEKLQRLSQETKAGIAREENLQVITIESNLEELCPEFFRSVSDYRLASHVLCLQKLFGVYYLANSHPLRDFTFNPSDSSMYEPVILSAFSTPFTWFFFPGGEVDRKEKIRMVSDDPLSRRYLHPCILPGRKNCSRCVKCVRTMMVLWSQGRLEEFRDVFDVDMFLRCFDDHLCRLIADRGNDLDNEALEAAVRAGAVITPRHLQKARIIQTTRKILQKASSKHLASTCIVPEEP